MLVLLIVNAQNTCQIDVMSNVTEELDREMLICKSLPNKDITVQIGNKGVTFEHCHYLNFVLQFLEINRRAE